MKMTESTAKVVSDLMVSIGAQLNESVRLVQVLRNLEKMAIEEVRSEASLALEKSGDE
jgi:hypothetical protein